MHLIIGRNAAFYVGLNTLIPRREPLSMFRTSHLPLDVGYLQDLQLEVLCSLYVNVWPYHSSTYVFNNRVFRRSNMANAYVSDMFSFYSVPIHFRSFLWPIWSSLTLTSDVFVLSHKCLVSLCGTSPVLQLRALEASTSLLSHVTFRWLNRLFLPRFHRKSDETVNPFVCNGPITSGKYSVWFITRNI